MRVINILKVKIALQGFNKKARILYKKQTNIKVTDHKKYLYWIEYIYIYIFVFYNSL